jgi:hypothetical protein
MTVTDNLRIRIILNEIVAAICKDWLDGMESSHDLRWLTHYRWVKSHFEDMKAYLPSDRSCYAVGVDENVCWTINIPSMHIKMNIDSRKMKGQL